MSRNDKLTCRLVPIPEGCVAKHLYLGPLPQHGLSQLVVIALICGFRIPFTIVMPDAMDNVFTVLLKQ